ncbi:MAG: carbohydrate ABC transporter permease [Clostridiales bacterium]|nr:carbohydrate ABC transporter permease [Clostridiales bacterium]
MEMRRKHNHGYRVFNLVSKILLGLFALLCLLPFVLMIVGSFTDNGEVIREGYSLFPKKWSTAAYDMLFSYPDNIIRAYRNTIVQTVVGTAISLFCISGTGYVLSRQDFQSRNIVAFYFYFTMLFGGGLIPWYIVMKQVLHLENTLWAIMVPSFFSAYNIFLMRNFIKQGVPVELIECSKLDGAGDARIYLQIVLPLSLPSLATIGLFVALGLWNDWYLCMLFISDSELQSLQYYLYSMLNSAKALREIQSRSGIVLDVDLPSETSKLAMSMVATGPILLVYPFIQRFFIKGLTVGAVKG